MCWRRQEAPLLRYLAMTRGTVDGTRKKEAIECIKAMQVQEDAEALLYDGEELSSEIAVRPRY